MIIPPWGCLALGLVCFDIIFIPSIIALFAIVTAVLMFEKKVSGTTFNHVAQALAIFSLAAQFIAWIILIIQYRRIKSKEDRKPLLIMLVAMTFGIAIAIYATQIAPAIADSFFNSPE